jgi:hypothetical protein
MVSFVATMGMLAADRGYSDKIEYRNGMLSFNKPTMVSIWRNQKQEHFDYLLPASIEKEPTR